jgi:hypothetical protein
LTEDIIAGNRRDTGLPKPTNIDRLSLITVPIKQYFNGARLGQGTVFVWRKNGQRYLVTNWHVIVAASGQCLFQV